MVAIIMSRKRTSNGASNSITSLVNRVKFRPSIRATGVAFKVIASDDVLVKKSVQFDLNIYVYGYQMPDGKFASMGNWQDSTSSHPGESMLLDAKEFTERVWVAGERFGYDVRGVSRDGRF